MAAYHKVEVSLNTNAVEVGIPSPQTVNVVVPTIGPAGPVGSVGPVGPQGPQGVPGTGLEVLTTQGDLLYQGASTGQRLAIGTSGQVLKVANGIPAWGNESGAVTSVNGETGAVSLSADDVGAAAAAHTHDGTQVEIVADDATGPVLAAGFSEGSGVNGIYWPTDTTANALLVYKLNRTYGMFFEAGRWHIYELAPLSANIVVSSDLDDTDYPHQSNWPTGSVTKASLSNFGDNAAQQFRFVGDSMAVTDVTNAVSTSDSRLTDSRTPTSHTHGNLTNAGAIGTTANLPLKTGTNGVIEAGSFGTAAGSFCAGDDVRLSDDRDPNLHAASHLPDGADELFDQSLNTTDSPQFSNLTLYNGDLTITNGVISGFGNSIDFENPQITGFGVTTDDTAFSIFNNGDNTKIAQFNTGGITTETTRTFSFPDASGTIALQGAITTSGLTQSTARILGRTTASTGSIEEIQIGSGLSLSAGELSATASGGISAVGASTADVLSVSGSDLVADDPNADRIVFWDDSEGKLRYLEAGSGLSISGTTMTATGGIGGGTGSTDNSILRSDGTGGSTLQDSAFVIADNATASPNNTVNHASIQATGGTTNVSVSIVPKGVGAFMLQVPNAAAGGGNARGDNAVDLQSLRSAATQVASGTRSFIGGGQGNTASAQEAVVLGGFSNLASGFQAGIFSGRSNTANADRSMAAGDGNTSSATNSFALGQANTASAANSVALGEASRADRRIFAHAAGFFAANGDAQSIRAVLRCKTTTNAAVEMALDGSTTYLTIPSGKVIFCNIKVVGVSSTGATVATFERQYAAKNVGGTSSEVFAAVTIGTDSAAGTSLEIATVDAGDYVRIRPTGLSATIFRWVASVDAVEVAFGT